MATLRLKNCEIRWPVLVKPNNNFDPEKPRWSLLIVTNNKAQKAEWEALGLEPKLKEDEKTGETYYQVRLSKNAYGEKEKQPPQVVDGLLNKVEDPNTIGNGSICNINVFQSEYFSQQKKKQVKRNTLMGVQVVKLIKYTPANSGFEEIGATEVIGESDGETTAPVDNPFA